MAFNEDSHVKIPTIFHLQKLGNNYFSLKGLEWERETNIVLPIFFESLKRLNPAKEQNALDNFYKDLVLTLDHDGNEFKIITQMFLCKFLNDKFAYSTRRTLSDEFTSSLPSHENRVNT